MTYNMIYLFGLLLLANAVLSFPNENSQNNPSSCRWLYFTKCTDSTKPSFELIKSFFPTLHVNFNNQAKNLQIGRIFPSVFTTTTKKYDKSENERKTSPQNLIAEMASSEAISNNEVNKETIANSSGNQIAIVDDFKSKANKLSAVNTETSTDTDSNTSTTTEESTTEEVTTEEVFYRLSDLSAPVIASLLG